MRSPAWATLPSTWYLHGETACDLDGGGRLALESEYRIPRHHGQPAVPPSALMMSCVIPSAT
jgi:hypothetical protein